MNSKVISNGNHLRLMILAFVVTGFTAISAQKNILPGNPALFRCNRATLKKISEGSSYALNMSGNKFAEISWMPESGIISDISVHLKALNQLKGTVWLKVIDSELEEYGSSRIPVASLLNGKTLNWKMQNLTRCSWSRKVSNKITDPLKVVMLVFVPAPGDKGKVLKLNLHSAKATYQPVKMPWSKRLQQLDNAWLLKKTGGATGNITQNQDGSYTFAKTNAKGYIELRLKQPINLTSGKRWYFRVKYHTQNASLGSLMNLRFPWSSDADPLYNSSGDNGKSLIHSLLVNSSPGEWRDYATSLKLSSNSAIYPSILLIGNPVSVKLKDLTIDALPKTRSPLLGPDEKPMPLSQAQSILATRKPASAKIIFNSNGNTTMEINGKEVAPVINKNSFNKRFWKLNDFSNAGVQIISVPVRISQVDLQNGVASGKNKYDFSKVDTVVNEALRRAPYAYFMLSFNINEPWVGWSQANKGEIWRGQKGQGCYGNAVHTKGFSNDLAYIQKRKMFWWPSYSSRKWHQDMGKVLEDTMRYISRQPYGKVIIGVQIDGGDDGQFQYRRDDFSSVAHKSFHAFLQKTYGSISKLNQAWKSNYRTFDEIRILPRQKSKFPFQSPGSMVDYCKFQNYESWHMREVFARAVKRGAGKDIFVSAYGQADSFMPDQLAVAPSLDMVSTIIGYPYRNSGYPLGMVQPELEYKLYKKLWMQELDVRSWLPASGDEFTDFWQGFQLNAEDWINMNRKLVGVSLARREGWWYYSMDYQKGRFFDAPEIMAEIKKSVKAYYRLQKLKFNKFKPDVCVVSGLSNEFYISTRAYRSVVNLNAQGNGMPIQQMMLETSGVPYDRLLLGDLLKFPQLQKYKIYIFLHNSFISTKQRKLIDKLLKNDNRTLIWVYSTGYISENGKSAANMQKLTGFDIETNEKYTRRNAFIVKGAPYTANVPELISFGNLKMSVEDPIKLRIWATPAQSFWITNSHGGIVIARYGDGKIAGAVKKFPAWTSIYLADHSSLAAKMLNNIVAERKLYRAANAGHSIFMNGNFASITPLYDDAEFAFYPPSGVTVVKDLHSGKELGKTPKVILPLKVGKTIWLSME